MIGFEHPGVRRGQQVGSSIEQGHFVLTMMPSLFCELDCPHCYLSKAERTDPTRLPNEDLVKILKSIDAYYDQQDINSKTIHAYQYGGEPTSMGIDNFAKMLDTIDDVFNEKKGYQVRHTILTSLVEVDLSAWESIFSDRCGGFLQTSYDGRMRGGRYMRKWEEKMKEARGLGLTLSTISVVNERILQEGPQDTLDYLSNLGVVEASFLPFMLNEQNNGMKYDRLAPSMDKWSAFMIELTSYWIEKRKNGEFVPEIGQLRFILGQAENLDPVSNIAGQTLFLLPNGDYALPDYTNGWKEYMNRFGNGIRRPFQEILQSPKRRAYLRKQVFRNGNDECHSCSHADKCVIEFWKKNRPGDDCFGGSKYIDWVVKNRGLIEHLDRGLEKTLSLY
jgi:sulfatase maturation enzyme AslB (radical SAM superfamily)